MHVYMDLEVIGIYQDPRIGIYMNALKCTKRIAIYNSLTSLLSYIVKYNVDIFT